MLEHIVKETDDEIRLSIDPHDGKCHGQHNIIVWAQRMPTLASHGVSVDVHVTYGWAGSAFLSQAGTEDFVLGLSYAIAKGEELRARLLHLSRPPG